MSFIDVALVFMLCGFTGGLWILKVLTHGDQNKDMPMKGFDKDGKDVAVND